jgi:hypothetical protein
MGLDVVEKVSLEVVEKASLCVFQKYFGQENFRIFPSEIVRDSRFVRGSEEHLLHRFDFFGMVPHVGFGFVVQAAINC